MEYVVAFAKQMGKQIYFLCTFLKRGIAACEQSTSRNFHTFIEIYIKKTVYNNLMSLNICIHPCYHHLLIIVINISITSKRLCPSAFFSPSLCGKNTQNELYPFNKFLLVLLTILYCATHHVVHYMHYSVRCLEFTNLV